LGSKIMNNAITIYNSFDNCFPIDAQLLADFIARTAERTGKPPVGHEERVVYSPCAHVNPDEIAARCIACMPSVDDTQD